MRIGNTINLKLSANAPPQQDSASTILSFDVTVKDPCPFTVISISLLSPMTNTVTLGAVSQAFALATDSKSTNTGVSSLCGPFQYDIIEAYSFITVTAGNISLASNSMADIGVYTPRLRAKLTNYPSVTASNVAFSATLINPCLTTSLALPTTLMNETITAFSGLTTT